MSYDSSLSSPNVLRANPLIGGDQQLTPNTSMDESLFLNEETSMAYFGGVGGSSNHCAAPAMDSEMKEQEGAFFQHIYVKLH